MGMIKIIMMVDGNNEGGDDDVMEGKYTWIKCSYTVFHEGNYFCHCYGPLIGPLIQYAPCEFTLYCRITG